MNPDTELELEEEEPGPANTHRIFRRMMETMLSLLGIRVLTNAEEDAEEWARGVLCCGTSGQSPDWGQVSGRGGSVQIGGICTCTGSHAALSGGVAEPYQPWRIRERGA